MSKLSLIYEKLNPITEMEISKDSNDGLMTLSGTFGVCGIRNNNKRVYERSNYSQMVTEMQSRIKNEGSIAGELEHPQGMNITLENISHKITDIQIDENGVVTGTIQLLNTPKGKLAQAIVEGGLPLFVSSRATGQIDKNGNVCLEKIYTYDLVGTPGFSQAKMHLNESQILEEIDENMYIISEKEENIDNRDESEKNEEINENKYNNDMELNEIQEQLNQLQNKLAEVMDENKSLREDLDQLQKFDKSNAVLVKLADRIQDWVVEEFGKDLKDRVLENQLTLENIIEQLAPGIQSWIVEEYSPEIQKWIINEYSPEIQKWVTDQYSQKLQDWITEELMPEIQNWVEESYGKTVKDMIEESLSDTKKSKLQNIVDTLKLLESLDTASGPKIKQPYNGRNIINENLEENEPEYISKMPDMYRPKYNMASQEIKESIHRRAKLYNFATNGAIDRFWEKIDFGENSGDQKSQNNTPAGAVVESLDNIFDPRERMIREQIRRWHR